VAVLTVQQNTTILASGGLHCYFQQAENICVLYITSHAWICFTNYICMATVWKLKKEKICFAKLNAVSSYHLIRFNFSVILFSVLGVKIMQKGKYCSFIPSTKWRSNWEVTFVGPTRHAQTQMYNNIHIQTYILYICFDNKRLFIFRNLCERI
jgi:hypothetical protein